MNLYLHIVDLFNEWNFSEIIGKDVKKSDSVLMLRYYRDIYVEGLRKIRYASVTMDGQRTNILTRGLMSTK
jgi:hypothetical protein